MKATIVTLCLIVAIIVSGLTGGFLGMSVTGSKTSTLTKTNTSTVTTTVTSRTTMVSPYTMTTNASAGVGIVSGLVDTGSMNIANLSSYKLVFHSATGQDVLVPVYPTNHFATSLPVGTYTVTGFSPGCNWAGCDSDFPKTVVVQFGMQTTIEIQASN